MFEITLVCSTHRENGRCSSAALFAILQSLKPEVIFHETPTSDLNSTLSLEGQALARCRASESVKLIAVDLYDPPFGLVGETKKVFDFIAQTCPEYGELEDERSINTGRGGFEYLNSPLFAKTTARLSQIEEHSIGRTRDKHLIRGLERWRLALQTRECGMVRRIYDYCQTNRFGPAVFLVGAGHRAGIVDEIARYSGPAADLVHWRFAYGSQPVPKPL